MSLNTILATAPLTTTNYVLKATGTTIGNSLIWDNGTNVGIGNQGTTYTLDVSGTGRFTGIVTFGSTLSNGTYAYTLPSATGTLALTSAIPANPVGGTGTTNTIPKFTASSTIGDSAITDNGTTVTLVSRALSGTSATFTSTITSNNAIGVEKNGSGTFGGGGRFYLYNAATTDGFLMQLNASNNIDYWGVTSNTPTASPVITFTRAGAATFANKISASNSAAGSATISTSNANTTDDAGVSSLNFDGNRLRLGVLPSDGAYGCIASSGAANTGLAFVTHNGTAWGERMRITPSGNVGIGVNPTERLHIYHSAGPEFRMEGGAFSWYIRAYNDNYNVLTPTGRQAISYLNNGDVRNYNNTTTWQQSSDVRVKENINTISDAIGKILSLNPVTFDYKQEFADKNKWDNNKKINNVGFIAQEFETIFPKYITTNECVMEEIVIDDFKSIDTGHLVAYLVKGMQEQQIQIQNLQEQINILAK